MEKKETNTLSIFQRPVWVSLFALTAAISWGWAYPLIKMGMEEYQITADMTGSKMLFCRHPLLHLRHHHPCHRQKFTP